jgi:predicted O-methyltransferase YrrM
MTLTTIVGQDRLNGLKDLLIQTIESIHGEIWECGVYLGGSASVIAETLKSRGIDSTIRLFDSFQGLPKHHEYDNYHREGDFAITPESENTIREYFKSHTNVFIHKGWIPDTFSNLEDSKISFCHLDIDLYEGYLAALEFVWPRLISGGIIVFDDYGVCTCLGATRAVDEFVKKNNIELQRKNGNDQDAFYIKKI